MASQNGIQGEQIDILSLEPLLTNVDAALLNGDDAAFYRNAGNLNAGIISDARLPATISSDITGNAATCTLAVNSSALGGSAASAYAKLASPIFTGNPRAPTVGAADNDTTIATTAFVQSVVGASGTGFVDGGPWAYSSASQQFFWTHGLGHRLNSLLVEMRCVIADGTWNVGDSVIVSTSHSSYSDSGGNCCGNVKGVFPWVDQGTPTSRVYVRVGDLGIQLIQQTSGSVMTATPGRWYFYLYAA